MIHFIDLRSWKYADGITAENIRQELWDIYNSFDADDETMIHWQGYKDLHAFGVSRIVHDFEAHDKKLESLWIKASA